MNSITADMPDPSCVSMGLADGCATYFAPPERLDHDAVRREAELLASAPLLLGAFDAMPSMVMVLNSQRQIVAANRAVHTTLGAAAETLLGLRPGEAVACLHAAEGPNGCGTSRPCRTCGAVRTILACRDQREAVVGECTLLTGTAPRCTPLELRVTATPIAVRESEFYVVAIEDISQVKRLAVLQRTFFHDVLNTAGCIQGYARFFVEEGTADEDFIRRLDHLAGQLVEAIQNHRDLLQAENGDLELRPLPVQTRFLLDELRLQFGKHAVAEGRTIRFGEVWDGVLRTDRQLLLRVLGNMLKNALEATPTGGIVALGCRRESHGIVFLVHNEGAMPDAVRAQIFRRSFSTKAATGRGIGTYSMKLFGERYLGGRMEFSSSESEGTTFTLTLPTVES